MLRQALSTLVRLGAPERQIRPDQIANVLRFPIDRRLWECWLRSCVVRGTLLERMPTGGFQVDLPVCNAEIEVYEVDPVLVIFPKIPDLVLERIRNLIRKPRPPPPPPDRFHGGIKFPPVPPGPGPDPAQFLGVASSVRRASTMSAMQRISVGDGDGRLVASVAVRRSRYSGVRTRSPRSVSERRTFPEANSDDGGPIDITEQRKHR